MDHRVALRYARALFQSALKHQKIQEVGDDLQAINDYLAQSGMQQMYFQNPRIPRNKKLETLREAFSKDIQPLTMRLLELLIEKRREKTLRELAGEYQRLQEEHQRIARADITSAVPLEPNEQQALIRKLEQSAGKQIIPTYHVDPRLIGGVKVRMGDYQIDGSARGMLDRLHDQIKLEIERRRTAR